MYTRLARFARKSGCVFIKSQLVKVFLAKIDKYLLDLALPMIIVDCGGHATFVEAFAVEEHCDHALY